MGVTGVTTHPPLFHWNFQNCINSNFLKNKIIFFSWKIKIPEQLVTSISKTHPLKYSESETEVDSMDSAK